MRRVLGALAPLGAIVGAILVAAVLRTFVPQWALDHGANIVFLFLLGVAGPFLLVVGLNEALGRRPSRLVGDRMWPALKRLASPDQPVRARRLPLAVGLPILLLLILVVLVVAIVTRDAAWTAGTAAIITMVVLAYQGWQIQQSTAVSAQAVVIGQAAWIEDEKRRLDHRAPRIHVSLGEPAWPPGGKRPVTEALGAGSPPQRVELVIPGSDPERLAEGHIFRLPKNANDPVSLWVEGQVLNEGEQTVQVHLRGLRVSQPVMRRRHLTSTTPPIIEEEAAPPWSEPGAFFVSLAPGRRALFRLEGLQPVSGWVGNHRALAGLNPDAAGRIPPEDRALAAVIKGTVEVDDGFENGVTDTWHITLTGFPLQPVPDEDASWQVGSMVAEEPPVMAQLSPLERRYWRSKQFRQELPSVEL